ncbi:hypothetical protein ABZ016_26580 [Streptomyces sp. NPDC006372]|uniref:hypothetical protein n=1 Tax=Streptomyces sp. NPDC006372 TaxID=3155599 RepID=UPI0033AF1235
MIRVPDVPGARHALRPSLPVTGAPVLVGRSRACEAAGPARTHGRLTAPSRRETAQAPDREAA